METRNEVDVRLTADTVTITLPLLPTVERSKSGKSLLLAKCGNAPSTVEFEGRIVKVTSSVYVSYK